MTLHSLLLDLSSGIALISATMVIASQNPIHSVVLSISVFRNATSLLLSLKIDFSASMFVIIHVGAIAVPSPFVATMSNIKLGSSDLSRRGAWLRYLPIGAIIGLVLLAELVLTPSRKNVSSTSGSLDPSFWGFDCDALALAVSPEDSASSLLPLFHSFDTPWSSLIDSFTNIQSLGFLIYTYFFYHLIPASLILLVAMIGAIVPTSHRRRGPHASAKQFISKQVSRNLASATGSAGS